MDVGIKSNHFLVGGFKHGLTFFPYFFLGIILPIGEVTVFSRCLKHLKTTNQFCNGLGYSGLGTVIHSHFIASDPTGPQLSMRVFHRFPHISSDSQIPVIPTIQFADLVDLVLQYEGF